MVKTYICDTRYNGWVDDISAIVFASYTNLENYEVAFFSRKEYKSKRSKRFKLSTLSAFIFHIIYAHFHNRKSNVNETDFAFGSGCVLSVPS